MMTPERWQRVKELFDRALEHAPGFRDGFLIDACGDDSELLAEVRSLLASDDEQDQFLESPAASVLGFAGDEVGEPGSRVGPYRILRVLGSGGMGVVYEAERADDHFLKRVAIKVIKRGMDSDLILRRFRQERQILAALDHPNIARLLDGGVTEGGLPYLVMEYVDGEPIHTYLTRRNLALRARVELFREVCGAVHFAHQNLVVHRDLKPSNILVSRDGGVKLLDFGVAKLLRADLALTIPLTELGDRVLTPAYASPEQMRGEQVTTASDVYTLGVILYELLAGRRPFDFSSISLEEVERMVCHEIPTRPSAAVRLDTTRPVAEAEARALRRKLTGELDNIVLMAMRKEPARRYASAAALSEDLARYLDGRPVRAQKDTAAYRIRKFAARHRAAVAGTAVVTVTLLGGAGTTLWQAQNANRERELAVRRLDDVHALTKTLIFDVHDAIEDLPGATAARELVLGRAFEYLERLASQVEGDRVLLRDVAEAYIRLALVRGQPAGASRGDLSGARGALERAAGIAAGLVSEDSSDLTAVRTLALSREKLGDVEAWTGNLAGGVEHARAALAGFQAIAARQPDDAGALLSVAISHVKLGDLLGSPHFPSLGDRPAAKEQYTLARGLLERAPLMGSGDAGARRYAALVHERLGSLSRAESRWAEALASYSTSLAAREELADASGRSMNAVRDIAVTLQNLCEVRVKLGDLGRAAADCDRAYDLFAELRTADPENVQTSEDLARIHASFSSLAIASGDPARAVAELKATIKVREQLLAEHPENVVNRRLLVRALADVVHRYIELARAPVRTGSELAGASAALKQAENLERTLSEEGVDTAGEQDLIATASRALAEFRGSP